MYQKVLVAAAAAFSLSSPALAESTPAPKPFDLNCQVFDAQGKELIPDNVISGKPSQTSQSLSAESELFYLDLELLDGTASLSLTDKHVEASARAEINNLHVHDTFSIGVVPPHGAGPSVIVQCTAL